LPSAASSTVPMHAGLLGVDLMKQARASHILVDSKGQAMTIYKQIMESKKPFKEFGKRARKHSTCPSRHKNGDLGNFGRGQMVAGFEMEVRKMEIGTMSEPVKTRFGYHLIWLHERID